MELPQHDIVGWTKMTALQPAAEWRRYAGKLLGDPTFTPVFADGSLRLA
jgi:hypothetical protein